MPSPKSNEYVTARADPAPVHVVAEFEGGEQLTDAMGGGGGVGVGFGVGLGVGFGVAVGTTVGTGVGAAVGRGVARGVGREVGAGVAVGVAPALGVGSAEGCPLTSSADGGATLATCAICWVGSDARGLDAFAMPSAPRGRNATPSATATTTRTATSEPIAANRAAHGLRRFGWACNRRRRSRTGVGLATISRFRWREAT